MAEGGLDGGEVVGEGRPAAVLQRLLCELADDWEQRPVRIVADELRTERTVGARGQNGGELCQKGFIDPHSIRGI